MNETLREIAGKLWQAPISQIVQGLNGGGPASVLLVKTPMGIVTVTLIKGCKEIRMLIKGKQEDYYCIKIDRDTLYDEDNIDKQIKDIATLDVNYNCGLENENLHLMQELRYVPSQNEYY